MSYPKIFQIELNAHLFQFQIKQCVALVNFLTRIKFFIAYRAMQQYYYVLVVYFQNPILTFEINFIKMSER